MARWTWRVVDLGRLLVAAEGGDPTEVPRDRELGAPVVGRYVGRSWLHPRSVPVVKQDERETEKIVLVQAVWLVGASGFEPLTPAV